MNIIVAGNRNYLNQGHVYSVLSTEVKYDDVIISGGARGVDRIAINYAVTNSIDCKIMNANWDRYGKSAGFIRNTEMAKIGDRLIAFYNGSSGTRHMINAMKAVNKPVLVVPIDSTSDIL